MVYLSAYDTTVGSGMNLSGVVHAIKESLVSVYPTPLDISKQADIHPYFITGKDSSANIPNFIHPLHLESVDRTKFICMDIRSFVRVNPSIEEGFVVKNQTEFDLAKTRLVMNLLWLAQSKNYLRDLSFVPSAVFSSLISESLSKRFALDSKDQLTLAVLANVYYQFLFKEKGDEFTEEEKQKFTTVAIKATRAPANFVFQIIDKIQPINNIEEFCSVCREVLQNVRIENLNAGLLITILSNTWYSSGKELVAVSLEHPPTWVSIVYAALNDKGYRNTVIAKIAERYTGNKGGSDFIKSFVAYYHSAVNNE